MLSKEQINFIDKDIFKARLNIEDVATQHYGVGLDRWNRTRCLFHNDDKPSLVITHREDKTDVFNCLGCKTSGTVYDFVMRLENCGFRDALEKLANWYPEIVETLYDESVSGLGDGSGRPRPTPNQGTGSRCNSIQQLANTDGADYLYRRKIPLTIAQQSGVAYTPDCTGRKALIFPMVYADGEQHGQEARFCSRKEPKAFADCEEGWGKGVFIALDKCKEYNKKMVICEGPFDALSWLTCGFPATALMGSTMRPWVPEFLKRLGVSDCVLSLDNDPAGHDASPVIAEQLLAEGIATKIQFVGNNAKYDINNYLQGYGRTKMLDGLANNYGMMPPIPIYRL